MSDEIPQGPDTSPSSGTSSKGAAESQTYTNLRDLAVQLAPDDKITARFIKGVVVSIETSLGQATCTIQLGGDSTTSIPGVRLLDSYSPVVGDTVQLAMQGQDIFVVGRINKTTPSNSVNGWVTPSLNSGFTASLNTPMYRVVWDNGDRKIQLRGAATISGTPLTLWTMPTDLRPLFFKSVLCGRDNGGGSNVVALEINTSGAMNLGGRTTGAKPGTYTGNVGGSTAAAVTRRTTQPTTAPGFNSPYARTSAVSSAAPAGDGGHFHNFDHDHDVTISGLSHQHDTTVSAVDSPTTVYLDGIEYFL